MNPLNFFSRKVEPEAPAVPEVPATKGLEIRDKRSIAPINVYKDDIHVGWIGFNKRLGTWVYNQIGGRMILTDSEFTSDELRLIADKIDELYFEYSNEEWNELLNNVRAERAK